MTVDEINLNRPEVGTGFSVISFLPVETLPIRLENLSSNSLSLSLLTVCSSLRVGSWDS